MDLASPTNSFNDDADREFYDRLFAYELPGVLKPESAEIIEARGWRYFLMKLMPFRFEEEFSSDHKAFWDLFWSVLMRIKQQQAMFAAGLVPRGTAADDERERERIFRENDCFIEPREYAVMLILARGLAKSSTLEAAAVVRACVLKTGYCLYISESQDQAEEHLGNIRELIEHDESRVIEFYPHMRVDPNAKVNGKKTKDRTDLFITVGGWIARAKGLNANLRGLRIGGLRPDHLVLDDIDGVNDSVDVSVKKARQISSSIIPTQARRWAMIQFGQNLILETGVMNQIYTGKVDILAERTTIGVSNTFEAFREGIEYRTFMDETDNRVKHVILPAAKPTWSGVSIAQAQKFLYDSGLDTFLAEYMNSFEHTRTERVFHAWDEKRHVVTWSEFERVFGVRHIPGDWRAKGAVDFGYSKRSQSAWLFAACSAKNTPLPSLYFAYRSRTFDLLHSVDDQAVAIWEDMFPDRGERDHGSRGRRHFEATQRFSDYPELFRMLDLKPRCSDLLARFKYDPWSETYVESPLDPAKATPEEKALWYVRQAQKSWRSQIGTIVCSHEKTGEQKTLAQKYGLPVSKTKEFRAASGAAEANHLLRGDFTRPHPFRADEQDPDTGLWKLGCPFLFVVVDDDQLVQPRDDHGFMLFRQQVANQRYTAEKMTEKGLSKPEPFKADSDHADAFRMLCANYIMPSSTRLTPLEEWQRQIPTEHRYKPMDERPEDQRVITPEMQMAMQESRARAADEYMRRKGLTVEDIFDGDGDGGSDYGFEDDGF